MQTESIALQTLFNDRLQLILMPTEQCNFRCTYCYEAFELKKMSGSVRRAVKNLISRRAESLSLFEIHWFGGEPLVAMDVIEELSRHALTTCGEEGVHFRGSMTTNGYLLSPKTFANCLELGIVSFQITFDGDRDVHDKSRVLGSGKGTFDTIWENVLATKDVDRDFRVVLRVHYTAENYKDVAVFMAKLHAVFGSDGRYSIDLESINPLGGKNDAAITRLTRQQKAEIEAYMWAASGWPAPASDVPLYICYAAHANSLIVRSDGKLSKCTVALESDFNLIGELTPEGEIVADQKKFQRWIAPVVEGRWDDVSCPVGSVAREAAQAGSGQAVRPARKKPRAAVRPQGKSHRVIDRATA